METIKVNNVITVTKLVIDNKKYEIRPIEAGIKDYAVPLDFGNEEDNNKYKNYTIEISRWFSQGLGFYISFDLVDRINIEINGKSIFKSEDLQFLKDKLALTAMMIPKRIGYLHYNDYLRYFVNVFLNEKNDFMLEIDILDGERAVAEYNKGNIEIDSEDFREKVSPIV